MLQHMDQDLPHMLHQHTVTVINIEKKTNSTRVWLLSTSITFYHCSSHICLIQFSIKSKHITNRKKNPYIQFVEVDNLVKKTFLISNFHLQYILYLCIPSNLISTKKILQKTSFFFKPYKHNNNSTQNMTRFSS